MINLGLVGGSGLVGGQILAQLERRNLAIKNLFVLGKESVGKKISFHNKSFTIENLDEIDRFCDALISIKAEIIMCSKDDTHNILKNSPHTLETLTSEVWNHNYSRKEAAYPLSYLESNKFWPTVTRIDDAFGDRNLICTCNPIEDYIKS